MLIIDAFIIFAPLIGYYSQYKLIKDNQSVGSFSIDICGILLISNILRIFYWFFQHYAFNLFIQSFLVISINIILLKLCIDLGYKKIGEKNGIWRWDTFDKFAFALINFAFFVGVLALLFIYEDIRSFGSFLGFLSLSIEATIGFPQFITNQVSKSVQGLSMFMIGTWFLGDLFKTIYYIIEEQPYQFIASGFIQFTIDILIIIQIIVFRSKNKTSIKYDQITSLDHSIEGQICGLKKNSKLINPFEGL